MKAGRYSMRFVVNNLKAKDKNIPQYHWLLDFQRCSRAYFKTSFIFNFDIQWSVGPRKTLRVEKHLEFSPLLLDFK